MTTVACFVGGFLAALIAAGIRRPTTARRVVCPICHSIRCPKDRP